MVVIRCTNLTEKSEDIQAQVDQIKQQFNSSSSHGQGNIDSLQLEPSVVAGPHIHFQLSNDTKSVPSALASILSKTTFDHLCCLWVQHTFSKCSP
mmetsp:Transcript_26777/g.56933  ORF Transcript_26777/g.56933 Transcript_26777/m.56933 type:complete len:95 (-) Transcript_26777:157-441(-)